MISPQEQGTSSLSIPLSLSEGEVRYLIAWLDTYPQQAPCVSGDQQCVGTMTEGMMCEHCVTLQHMGFVLSGIRKELDRQWQIATR